MMQDYRYVDYCNTQKVEIDAKMQIECNRYFENSPKGRENCYQRWPSKRQGPTVINGRLEKMAQFSF